MSDTPATPTQPQDKSLPNPQRAGAFLEAVRQWKADQEREKASQQQKEGANAGSATFTQERAG